MLFEAAPKIDIREQSPLSLAFVGDAVLELLVRQRLVETTRLLPGRLHTVATRYVSARAQSRELAILEPVLTEEEANVLRRGKNASKATVAKHATAQEYRASTGFECLLGYLYLKGRNFAHHVYIVASAVGKKDVFKLVFIKNLKKLIALYHLAVRRRLHKGEHGGLVVLLFGKCAGQRLSVCIHDTQIDPRDRF